MPLIRSTFTPGAIPAPSDPPHWLALLQGANSAQRREAAIALGQLPDYSTALIACLDQETDPVVSEAVIGALAMQGDAEAVNALLDCLRSEEAGLRNDAIEALKSAGSAHPQLIQAALSDSDSDVRILTCGILQALPVPQVESWLIELLEQESHVNVCACAIDLLCEIGTAQSMDVLEQCRERFAGEDYLVFAIDLALTRLSVEPAQ